MDQDEFTSAFNEYLFSASNYEDSYPVTIDPALLQTSASAFDFHVEQEEQPAWDGQSWPAQPFGSGPRPSAHEALPGDDVHPTHEHMGPSHVKQHFIASKSPFKCHCDKEFKSLYTLQRHIQGTDKGLVPEHPCPECIVYQGKNGFRRKDNLVQHLRFFHKYDDDQLATLFLPRQTRMLNIPVCRYVSCEYYRGPDFKDLGIREQGNNRPFHKQSDYTTHMKHEHDWSPHPCKVPGCSKLDGKGFFSATALEKHCKEKHPGIAATVLNSQNQILKEVRCDYCRNWIRSSKFAEHQRFGCGASCRYCRELIGYDHVEYHKRSKCKGEVACGYCHEPMEFSQLRFHEKHECKGEVACRRCSKLFEKRLLYNGYCNESQCIIGG